MPDNDNGRNLDYMRLLARQHPTIQSASTEIINLNARLDLPKGTEHYISDVHGEYEAFVHVLKNGSGSIKRKIDEHFGNSLTEGERRALGTLIYYPEQKIPMILKTLDDDVEWYRITLFRLIKLCRIVASKYTRAAVREALPTDFATVIEELLHEQEGIENRQAYYQSIVNTIIEIGRGRAFVEALCELIQRLAIAQLHLIGDVYDRGPGAHIIMDTLMDYHAVDVQWGNHDIVWMGAAAGSEACMTNVIRMCLRYANMETLLEGYAISLLPLTSFAVETYGSDSCALFMPKVTGDEEFTKNELLLMAQMHKAITVIQLKLEAQIIMRQPEYQMQDRLLLDKIDLEAGTVTTPDGRIHPLLDTHFPTIDPADPFALTPGETAVVDRLRFSFKNSERLQRHMRFLLAEGSMYLVHNGHLLYHGCIPMTDGGEFATFEVNGRRLKAREFMDYLERLVRQGYFSSDPVLRQEGRDTMWYLWTGPLSPIFGKDKMATFERYFIADKTTHTETKNAYYKYRDRTETVNRILREFGLEPENGRIVNGHVPVKVAAGESPVKANGSLLVIDGGFSKAYQKQTGIAGYTLIYNSFGLLLTAHEPFESAQKAIELEQDMHSSTQILEHNKVRMRVRDTDDGRIIQHRIADLKALLAAYRDGVIKENLGPSVV